MVVVGWSGWNASVSGDAVSYVAANGLIPMAQARAPGASSLTSLRCVIAGCGYNGSHRRHEMEQHIRHRRSSRQRAQRYSDSKGRGWEFSQMDSSWTDNLTFGEGESVSGEGAPHTVESFIHVSLFTSISHRI